MKKIVLILGMVITSIASFGQLPVVDTSNVNKVQVLDSIVTNDVKLLIVADRLYSKNGLIDVLVTQASKEKAETGKIEKQAATQNLIENLNQAYDKFLKKFITVDTLWVDTVDVKNKISQITEWQQSVLLDPEIKNATSLSVWENKDKELQKLRKYKSQFTK
jgi:hypothetical protein